VPKIGVAGLIDTEPRNLTRIEIDPKDADTEVSRRRSRGLGEGKARWLARRRSSL